MSGVNLIKVSELRPDSRRVNLRLKVLGVGAERQVYSSRDGSLHRVAEALVGDETGIIKMTLWDDDIDLLRSMEGSTILLVNGYISVYKNSMRLNIGRYGRVEESDVEVEQVNEQNNLSEHNIPNPLSKRPFKKRSKKFRKRKR